MCDPLCGSTPIITAIAASLSLLRWGPRWACLIPGFGARASFEPHHGDTLTLAPRSEARPRTTGRRFVSQTSGCLDGTDQPHPACRLSIRRLGRRRGPVARRHLQLPNASRRTPRGRDTACGRRAELHCQFEPNLRVTARALSATGCRRPGHSLEGWLRRSASRAALRRGVVRRRWTSCRRSKFAGVDDGVGEVEVLPDG